MFTKLVGVDIHDGAYSLCLDRFEDSDQKDLTSAFVWRGNSRGPEGFQNRPAAFSWHMLGQLIRKALDERQIQQEEVDDFLKGLAGVEKSLCLGSSREEERPR